MEAQQKKKNKYLPFILGAVILIAGYFGFTKIRYIMTHEDTENAYLEADILTVSPKVQGFISKVYVEENQYIKTGDTLFILDNRDYILRVEQAAAALQQAEANVGFIAANASTAGANVGTAEANYKTSAAGVETSSSAVQTAQANVDAAQARARQLDQDFKRFAALLPQKVVTQQQYDAAKAAKENADASVQAAQSQLETARRQVEVSKLQTQAGQSQKSSFQTQATAASRNVAVARTLSEQRRLDLEQAKLNLSYTVITAPSSGHIARKTAQIGQLANVGSPLCSLVSDKSLWVTANFKETQVGKMQPGQAVSVSVDAYDGAIFNGKIEGISPATGAKFSLLPPDNASGNFVKVVQRIPVRVILTDAPDPARPLRAGMSVKVMVPTK